MPLGMRVFSETVITQLLSPLLPRVRDERHDTRRDDWRSAAVTCSYAVQTVLCRCRLNTFHTVLFM